MNPALAMIHSRASTEKTADCSLPTGDGRDQGTVGTGINKYQYIPSSGDFGARE